MPLPSAAMIPGPKASNVPRREPALLPVASPVTTCRYRSGTRGVEDARIAPMLRPQGGADFAHGFAWNAWLPRIADDCGCCDRRGAWTRLVHRCVCAGLGLHDR